ncbi:hypothetical protein EVAR_74456_1 [Eumeta japonica]|uniref:Uncharacterized protein n=1 Tax=Eumeta variegata TaxID=151549 RepID=A0A4C1YPR9_EUMVA|nr:hypothetical protein EVAR_74456_1 [Eumeta japonica]
MRPRRGPPMVAKGSTQSKRTVVDFCPLLKYLFERRRTLTEFVNGPASRLHNKLGHFRGANEQCELPQNMWSSPPMDTRNPKLVTRALLAF